MSPIASVIFHGEDQDQFIVSVLSIIRSLLKKCKDIFFEELLRAGIVKCIKNMVAEREKRLKEASTAASEKKEPAPDKVVAMLAVIS